MDKREDKISAQAAEMGLEISAPVFSDIPEEILDDSEIFFSFDVKNTGTVPVYAREGIKVYANGKESYYANVDSSEDNVERDIIDKYDMENYVNVESMSDDWEIKRLEAGETINMKYRLTFSEIDSVPDENLLIKGVIQYAIATSEVEPYGFTYGPINRAFELSVKRRPQSIGLDDIVYSTVRDEKIQNDYQIINYDLIFEDTTETIDDEYASEELEYNLENLESGLKFHINTQSEIEMINDNE